MSRQSVPSLTTRCARLVRACALLLVAACSGGDKIVGPDGTNGGGNSNQNTALVAADSAFLAQTASGYVLQEFNSMRTMGLNGSAPLTAPTGAPAGCITTTGGADANKNGIPDDMTQTFNTQACTTTNNGTTVTIAGSVRLQDVAGVLGYKLTYNAFKVTASTADTTVSISLTGTQEVAFTDARTAHTINATSSVLETRSKTGSVSLTIARNLNGTFAAASNFTPKAAFPGGTFTVAGTFTVGIALAGDTRGPGDPANASFTVTVNTTRVLNFDGFCSSQAAFNNGELAGQVTGYAKGSLAVRFTSCGTGTTTPPTTKK